VKNDSLTFQSNDGTGLPPILVHTDMNACDTTSDESGSSSSSSTSDHDLLLTDADCDFLMDMLSQGSDDGDVSDDGDISSMTGNSVSTSESLTVPRHSIRARGNDDDGNGEDDEDWIDFDL
jgi:hypothetical protein